MKKVENFQGLGWNSLNFAQVRNLFDLQKPSRTQKIAFSIPTASICSPPTAHMHESNTHSDGSATSSLYKIENWFWCIANGYCRSLYEQVYSLALGFILVVSNNTLQLSSVLMCHCFSFCLPACRRCYCCRRRRRVECHHHRTPSWHTPALHIKLQTADTDIVVERMENQFAFDARLKLFHIKLIKQKNFLTIGRIWPLAASPMDFWWWRTECEHWRHCWPNILKDLAT